MVHVSIENIFLSSLATKMENEIKKKNHYFIKVSMYLAAVLIADNVNKQTNIINQQKLVKNPNWEEADQLATYKAWRS